MSETNLKVDSKGRIALPAKIRRELRIGKYVKVKVEENRVILTPVDNPLNAIQKLVVKGTKNVEHEVRLLRKKAEAELFRKRR